MTLTLPTPNAGDTARQRFTLELLLQQPVPGPEQLLASRKLLSEALPDVILVGEMRDLETIQLAVSAAETGHLVFGTLHTSSAAQLAASWMRP